MDTAITPAVGDALRSSTDLLIGFASDFFAFIVVAALVAAFAFYFGRDRLIPLVTGVVVAVPLYTYFPFKDLTGADPFLNLGLYIVFAVVSMLALSGLQSWVPSSGVGFVKVLGLSAISAGVILAVAISLLPLGEVYSVSAPTQALFASHYFFYWLAAGVAGVFLLGR